MSDVWFPISEVLLGLIESPKCYYAAWKTKDQQQVSVVVWCPLEMAVGVKGTWWAGAHAPTFLCESLV